MAEFHQAIDHVVRNSYSISQRPHAKGSALGPSLFVMVMDVSCKDIRNEELWELLYAEDVVITDENEEDLQRRSGSDRCL